MDTRLTEVDLDVIQFLILILLERIQNGVDTIFIKYGKKSLLQNLTDFVYFSKAVYVFQNFF